MNTKKQEQERIIELLKALHRTEQEFFDFLYRDGDFVGIEGEARPDMAKVSDAVVERYADLLLTKSEELNKNVLEVEKHGRCIASSSAGDEVQTEWRALSKAVSLLMADLYMIGSKRGFAHKLDAALTPAGAEGWFSRLMKRFGC